MENIGLRQNGRFFFGWLILLFSFLLMAVGYAGILTVSSIFVVPVTGALGCTRSGLMLYVTVMTLSSVLFARVYSPWMGRGQKALRWILMGNALAVFLAYLGFAAARQLWQFYLLAPLLGSGFAALNTLPVSILLTNWFGGRIKGTVMALAFTGSGLGGLVLAPVLSLVLEQFGWRQGYVLLGFLFLVIIAPLSFFFSQTSPEAMGFTKMGMRREEAALPQGLSYEEAKRKPYFWLVVFGFFLIVLGSGALIAHAAAYFKDCGLTAAGAAAFTGYMSGMLTIGKPVCGILCDRKGIPPGVFICFGLMTLCFLQLAFMARFPFLIYGVITCYGFGFGAITTLPPLIVTELFGERDYGKILGFITMAVNLSLAVAGFLAGWIYDKAGTYFPYWVFTTLGAAVTTLLVLWAFRLKRQEMAAI